MTNASLPCETQVNPVKKLLNPVKIHNIQLGATRV